MVRSISALSTLLLGLVWTAAVPAAQPNILIILADDMGYGDLGCMGSEHLRTPNMDALAKSGVLCTQAYVASSVCSPSRAGLLTGRDPRRFGYEGNLNQSSANYATRPELLGLPPGEWTLADHLRAAGYATSLIGKWHQGTGPGFHPQERGFDYFCGMLGGGHTYFPDPANNKLERNGDPLKEFSSPYLTDFFTDEAIDWIRKRSQEEKGKSKPEKPWFMYLSYNAPHGPLQATEDDLARFEHLRDRKRRTYAAMVWAMDRGVGRVVDELKQSGQMENTLIVFFSDNGGATGNASWNGPLSGCKGCLKEGGVRIPMMWSWPVQIPKNRTSEAVMSSLDLLPTFMAAADAKPLPLGEARSHEDEKTRARGVKKFGAYDGIDLLPILTGKAKPVRRTLFWRLQGQAAIRAGDLKLVRLSHRPAEFFNPAEDIAESEDLSQKRTSEFRDLYRQLAEWEALLPTVPLWDSSPYWQGQSARQYDSWVPRAEPK